MAVPLVLALVIPAAPAPVPVTDKFPPIVTLPEKAPVVAARAALASCSSLVVGSASPR